MCFQKPGRKLEKPGRNLENLEKFTKNLWQPCYIYVKKTHK